MKSRSRVMTGQAVSILALCLFLSLALAGCGAKRLPVIDEAPGFILTDQNGKALSFHDLAGKVRLVSFIYTNCPDICPLITANMVRVQSDLKASGLTGDDFRFVSISVDPERDTPDVLAEYAKRYGADTSSWHFVTGPVEDVRRTVTDGFYMAFEKAPASGHSGHSGHGGEDQPYWVLHSGYTVLVDGQGNIRAVYGEDWKHAQVVKDIKALVKEGR